MVGIPIGLTWGATARLDDSLVANPLQLSDPTVHDGTGPGRNARPDPVAVLKTSMAKYCDHLGSKFFSKDLIDRKPYTIWIFAALGMILGIWVVAGLELMTAIAAVSSGFLSSSLLAAAAPLYAGLLVGLTISFIGILFMVHRARQPACHEPVSGFAGFVWELQD